MSTTDYLKDFCPELAMRLPRIELASLPTPVASRQVEYLGRSLRLSIKFDNLTSSLYGGNKVRKLEYIFPRASSRHCRRIATFGAAGSNHALATALYATQAGFASTCFLSHQAATPQVAATLNRHIENRTEIVRYGGSYATRLATLREKLWNRQAFVIPMGGSSWLGAVGFVAAGLELAAQVAARDAGGQAERDWGYIARHGDLLLGTSVEPGSAYPEDLDVLIAVQPSTLEQAQVTRLKDYIASGKPTLLMIDPLPAFNIELSPQQTPQSPFQQQQPQKAPADLSTIFDER